MPRKRREPPIRHPRGPAPTRRGRAPVAVGAALTLAALILGGWLLLGPGSSGETQSSHNFVQAPASGPVRMAGVEVLERAFNIGRIPLDTPVSHTFRLSNVGATTATVGKVRIEVLKGCCPPDPVVTATSIAPGGESQLFFDLPMGMHKGMGGPHLFRITVPVQSGSESGEILLYVSGMFG